MKKRLIALFLCSALLFGMFPVALTMADPDTHALAIYAEGAYVEEVELEHSEKLTLTAMLQESGAYDLQWQIRISGDNWANIVGSTGTTLELSYPMVANLLSGGVAAVRCRAINGVDNVTYSNVVTVGVTTSASVAGTPAADTADSPVVLSSGMFQVATAEASAPAADEAGETEASGEENVSGIAVFSDEGVAVVDNASDVKKTYNIVVNYTFENNEIVADPYTANLAEGSSFSATVTFPEVLGYLPYVNDVQQDSIVLDYLNVSEDVTINVVYKPTNVNYTVIHYQQNVDNDGYTEAERETKQGLTASTVPEVAKTYEGFYSLLYERPAIAADGGTVIEVYYDRYYYLMNFDMDGGYGTEPVYARYGASVGTVTNPTKAGYTFGGWSVNKDGTAVTLPATMPAGNMTYHAIWNPDNTAKVTVVFWGENADDEGYSYLADCTKVINLKPGKEFTYSESGMLVCDKKEHSHTDDCYKLICTQTAHNHSATCCTHVHDLTCYSTSGSFILDNNHGGKTESEMENLGNGLYKYVTGLFGANKHYYVKIGDNWYRSSNGNDNAIRFVCSHKTHDAQCCKDGLTEHTHTTENCYENLCGQKDHTHNSDCYMNGAGLDNKLWKFVKSDTITVAADGSSVVNVYYDRVEKTLTFKYDYKQGAYNKTETITAKWGQNIATKYNAIVNNAGSSFWSDDSDYSSPYTNYFGVMPQESKTYYYKSDSGSNGTMYYYGEDLNGNYVEMFSVSNVGGYTVTVEDHYEFKGFTYDHGTSDGSSCSNAKFYYTRNSYKLTFNDGYKDTKTESVKFEAPLGTYKDYVPEVPSAYEPGSVMFGGWYQNPQCTGDEYKLTEHKMPSNDIILYAKWVPVKHTVTFYLDQEAYDAGTKLESHPAITVPHGELADPTPIAPTKGSYEFIGWFYMDNGVEKAFDFANMQVRKDLDVYGKWSSNTLKQYTVQYVLKDDHSVKIADDLTGSGLAGTTKTFDAKGGTELYAAYQEGYFPTVQSQSLLLDIESNSLVITFEYVPMPAVPYTVKYVEKDTGKSLADDKVVSDNRKAVVTETFQPISGYMPDAYQKRLVVTADGENILYFYYTKDATHAYYKITHYTQNTDGATWTDYASSQVVGDIGTRYTASPMTIPGFTYQETKYAVNGTDVTDVTTDGAKLTADGLEINLYYVRNDYPYQVRYLEQGSGKVLHDPKSATGKYGQVISESAIDIDGYDKVNPTSATISIKIETDNAAKLNVITFYYKEQEVTINYVAVGPTGATNFGSVNPTTETVKAMSGAAQGSTPTAGDGFRFVGWFKDEACTEAVDASWVESNKLTPQKTNDKNVAATYYAKFEYDVTSLTIQKKANGNQYDTNEMFIFNISGPDGYTNRVVVKAGESVTINGLKVGSAYTVTEDTSWSWRYTTSSDKSNPITLTATASSNVVVFTNTLSKHNWLTGDAYADNNFNK